MPVLPFFSPRPPPPHLRWRRRRSVAPTTLAGLMSSVIAAVNERGLCAVEVARLAYLPTSEVNAMGARCGCRACFGVRAN